MRPRLETTEASLFCAFVAQLVEHPALNRIGAGSTPAGGTKKGTSSAVERRPDIPEADGSSPSFPTRCGPRGRAVEGGGL
jgi:hypothetical protein